MSLALDGPPLDPPTETAREWLREELSKGIYHTRPSLWQRFLDWLLDHLPTGDGSLTAPDWLFRVLVAVAVVGILVLLVRTLRREVRAGRRRVGAVLTEEGLDAQAYRDRARRAAERGDVDAQLLDSYRAIAASGVERTLLTDLPGRTAHEVAVELAPVFPDAAGRLAAAADLFDAVRYGGKHVDRAAADGVTKLDRDLLATRPVLDSTAPASPR